jgi:YbgC/YbaW family acyl-CoA thioester hydrolase
MHTTTIHVYPTDCDMLGHVNHATMITFLEHARWAMLEPHMTVHDWFRMGVWPVVRHVDIAYRAQATPGDDLEVRSGLVGVGTTSFSVRQRVRRSGDARSVAEATITFVCIDRGGQKVPVPDEWRRIVPAWREELGDA